MGIFGDVAKKYRVFCPHCGDQYLVRELPDVLAQTIDRLCRVCKRRGVDAVESDREAA